MLDIATVRQDVATTEQRYSYAPSSHNCRVQRWDLLGAATGLLRTDEELDIGSGRNPAVWGDQ